MTLRQSTMVYGSKDKCTLCQGGAQAKCMTKKHIDSRMWKL